jgi:3-hydroxy-D-aspartate aldolase
MRTYGPFAPRKVSRGDIGVEGGGWWLSTPYLLLDLDALDRNIAAMALRARAHGVGLRPHSKRAKSIAIAQRQMAAGALASAVRRSAKSKS